MESTIKGKCMKTEIILAILFGVSACRHTQVPPNPDPTAASFEGAIWADFAPAWDCMRQATHEVYGPDVTQRVHNIVLKVDPAISGRGAAGLTWRDGRVWVRRADGENRTLDSVLAHEVWEHRLPWVLQSDDNPNHLQQWHDNRHVLHSRAWRCLIE